MNRGNKILLGVLVFVVVCVVGYALFSEAITITGTATAKGDFNITTTCTKGVPDNIDLSYWDVLSASDNGYENDVCNVNDNIVSFSADLKYPTAARKFTIKITNTGSITSYIDLQYGINFEEKLCYDGANNGAVDGIVNSDECTTDTSVSFAGISLEPVAVEKKDGTLISILDETIEDFISDDGVSLVLKSGESAYFVAWTIWGENATLEVAKTGITHEVNATFNFMQEVAQ